MELSTILAMLSIFVSSVLGTWGIILIIKHRYPGQLTFVREQRIALFDTIVKNLPELAVLYKNEPVGPNLVLMKWGLVNTGRKDISPTMIEAPITVSVPERFKWVAAKVVSTSKGVKASIQIEDNKTLQIDIGLLRRKEFVRLEALAEVPTEANNSKDAKKSKDATIENRLEENLKFSHRIEDTGQINIVKLRIDESARKRLKRTIFPLLGVMVILGIAAVVISLSTRPEMFIYPFQKDSTQTIRVKIESLRGGTVKIKSLDDSYEASLTPDEFFAKTKQHPSVVADTSETQVGMWMGISYICLPLIGGLLMYRKSRAAEKLQELLDSEESGS